MMMIYHWATVGSVHRGSGVGSVVAAVPRATLIRETHSPVAIAIRPWTTWPAGTLKEYQYNVTINADNDNIAMISRGSR